MRAVRVPALDHAAHARIVARVPDAGLPVGVHHQRAAAGPQHAPQLAQRSLDVRHVLVDLRTDGGVERAVRIRQFPDVADAQLHPWHCGAAALGKRNHAGREIDAVDAAGRAHQPGHVQGQQARSAAQVDHPLAGRERQRCEHSRTLRDHVGCEIDRLGLAGALLVELLGDACGGVRHLVARRKSRTRIIHEIGEHASGEITVPRQSLAKPGASNLRPARSGLTDAALLCDSPSTCRRLRRLAPSLASAGRGGGLGWGRLPRCCLPHPTFPRKRGKENLLPQKSNCNCHPGRAGGPLDPGQRAKSAGHVNLTVPVCSSLSGRRACACVPSCDVAMTCCAVVRPIPARLPAVPY